LSDCFPDYYDCNSGAVLLRVVLAHLRTCPDSCPDAEGEETVTAIVRAGDDEKTMLGVVERLNDG
jgi:hypothetical protein